MHLSEIIIDQLKNLSQTEHSRDRGVINYFADIVTGFMALVPCRYSAQTILPQLAMGLGILHGVTLPLR